MTPTTTARREPQNESPASPPSPALAAYLYANDCSIYELLENYPALEIDDLPATLRLARGLAVEYGAGDGR